MTAGILKRTPFYDYHVAHKAKIVPFAGYEMPVQYPTGITKEHLIVRESNLADPRVWDGPATYEIYDSSLDHAAAYRDGLMYLENCTISNDIEVKNYGTYIYGFGLSSKWSSDPFQIFELDV